MEHAMDHIFTIIVALGIFLFHLSGLLTGIDALLQKRSSQGTIAWIFSLVLFPYLALPLYWILGRSDFKGYTNFRTQSFQEIEELSDAIMAKLIEHNLIENRAPTGLKIPLTLSHIPLFKENSVELLPNGEATFTSIFEGISQARTYVLVQFYIIEDDELGNALLDALIERAQAGVRVFLLYDRVGSKLSKKFLKRMAFHGIKAYDFYAKPGLRNPFRMNFRNHRKIVVVDGKTCWIGGHNVSNEYLGKGRLGFWRDTHIKLEGASVLATQLSFVEDWYWVTKRIEDLSWNPFIVKGDSSVLIVPTGPADSIAVASLSFLHLINSAQERLWIASPYFVPDDALLKALQGAALRGVDVRILIPDNPDHFLVYHATFAYFEDVLSSGVKFYRYTNGFMHQKVVLLDSDIASVGTLNFDNRSFYLNFEVTAFVHGVAFAQKVEAMLEDDFTHARVMSENDLRLSTLEIIKSRFAHLFAPIL